MVRLATLPAMPFFEVGSATTITCDSTMSVEVSAGSAFVPSPSVTTSPLLPAVNLTPSMR
jgi:hypothetical protein